jgi:PQQ-dependent catabolism-associated CXXCW motif protein
MNRAISLLMVLSVMILGVRAEEGVAEPEHYRDGEYRAPTPGALKGARVVSTSDAVILWKSRAAIFVDVMPRPPRPPGLPRDIIWRDKPRFNIPGSIWLPDTGYGRLAVSTVEYFRHGLEAATGGDQVRTVVFYCLKDCWMSWNAAKRAIALGYTDVVWYPDGTDGWRSAGLPVEEAKPAPAAEQPN